MSLEVPVVPEHVSVLLATEGWQEVTIYLSATSRTHGGPETLLEFLNHERPFLPAHLAKTGKAGLLGHGSIVALRAKSGAPEDEAIDLVKVTIEGGQVFEGVLAHPRSETHPRVSDALNQGGAYFALSVGDSVLFINKNRVLEVTF